MPRSIKEFLWSLRRNGVALNSAYELTMSSTTFNSLIGDKITFYASSFDYPGFNYQFGTQAYWRGQVVEIPITWDQERDFNMTVVDSADGKIYAGFVNLIQAQNNVYDGDASQRKLWNGPDDLTIRVTRLLPNGGIAGPIFVLKGCRFKSVGSLSFSNSDASILSFSVSGTAAQQLYEQKATVIGLV